MTPFFVGRRFQADAIREQEDGLDRPSYEKRFACALIVLFAA